ncbi:MAG: hypothetical protein JSV19_07615 [Phycisphaerales bacterium]|nr:MAG: hypothetical protein JSV19_07615 [Phycisphaerales bacterium]
MHDDLREDEYPDQADWADADDPDGDQVACPECGQWVFDDTQKCPYCGNWIVPSQALASRRSWVVPAAVLLMAVLMLLITIRWWLL